MLPSEDPEYYQWYILPRRKVAHIMVERGEIAHIACGLSRTDYRLVQLEVATSQTRRCEQCLIVMFGERYKHPKPKWRIFVAANQSQVMDWRKHLPELSDKKMKQDACRFGKYDHLTENM